MYNYLYQLLIGTSGFLLLYAGIFVYPDERQNLHNILEDLWLRWAEKSDVYEGKFTKFGKAVSIHFTALFDKYFGEALISRRSIMTSVVLSTWLSPMLALVIATIVGLYKIFSNDEINVFIFFFLVIISCLLFHIFVRWILKGIIRESFITKYSSSTFDFLRAFSMFVVVGPVSLLFLVFAFNDGGSYYSILFAFVAIIILLTIVVGSDIISIYVTRLILSKIRLFNSSVRISIAFILDALAAVTCATFPAFFLLIVSLVDKPFDNYIFAASSLALIMNITTLTPTFAYLGISLVIGLNGLLWQSTLRPLYSLIDNKIFEKKRSLATLGCLLIAGAIEPGVIKGLAKTLLSLLS